MDGTGFVGLILFSMLWLFVIGGFIVNWGAFWQQTHRKEGERAWSGFGFVPGVFGSFAIFLTVGVLLKAGFDVPWPWLWILLPLFLDPFCLGWIFLIVFGALFGRR